MKRTFWVALLGVALCCPSLARADEPKKADEPKNLIENGGFENGQEKKGAPDGWSLELVPWTGSQGTVAWVKDEKHSGTYSVKLQQTNDKGRLSVRYIKTIPVKPDESYVFTGWMKTDFPAGNDKGRAYMIVNECKGETLVRERTTIIIMKTTDWTKYELPMKVSAGVDNLMIMMTINNGAGTMWLDDISLVKE